MTPQTLLLSGLDPPIILKPITVARTLKIQVLQPHREREIKVLELVMGLLMATLQGIIKTSGILDKILHQSRYLWYPEAMMQVRQPPSQQGTSSIRLNLLPTISMLSRTPILSQQLEIRLLLLIIPEMWS